MCETWYKRLYMYIPFLGGRIHNQIHTDYLYRLIEANSEEVRKMASDNGIILFINELTGICQDTE